MDLFNNKDFNNEGRLTKIELEKILNYHPETGVFTWRKPGKGRIWSAVAGNMRKDGYCALRLGGRIYLRHRLVWLFETGEWPRGEIDHLDRTPGNDKFSNLRVVTREQNRYNINSYNRTTGVRGVTPVKKTGKFRARIQNEYIGTFNTIEAAKTAYNNRAKQLFGEFYNDAN